MALLSAAPIRQRLTRLPVTGINVEIPEIDLELHLRDLGYGGFSMVAPRSFSRGMTRRFRFTTDTGLSIVLAAKTAYCNPIRDGAQPQRFVTGWEFMIGSADRTDDAVSRLLASTFERARMGRLVSAAS